MKRSSIAGLTLAVLVGIPTAVLAQDKPERERVNETVTTPFEATFTGCTEAVHVTGTLVSTVRAGGVEGGNVHNVSRTRLTDVTAVGVTSGSEYKVSRIESAQRSYEFGGTQRHVAHASERLRIMGPGPGNDFVTNIKWQYRQDQDGNVVVNELQIESGCKKP